MTELDFLDILVPAWLVVAAVTAISLLFIVAPYGRHARKGWGPAIPSTWAWILMEAPSPLGFAFFFATGTAPITAATIAFLLMWETHYVHRAFVYPFLRRGGGTTPVSIVLMGVFFNLVNAYMNGRWLFALSGGAPAAWLADPRFLAGMVLFVAGLAANLHSDRVLRNLRAPGETGYKVPRGGLYRWVTCPNYLGEVLEWAGWAIATWSLPGVAFAAWTAANLIPRAIAHHRWYRSRFPDYPPDRRAILPYLL